MTLFYFLLRSSWRMVAIAIVTGLLGGSSSAAVIALISTTLSRNSSTIATVLGGFVGLALVAGITSLVSKIVLVRLSQNAVFQLRMHLCQRILSSDLRHLERLGSPRLMATLTEDVQAISNAVQAIPFLCIDCAIVAGCLVYLVWLYWSAIVLLLLLFLVGWGSCQWLLDRGRQIMVRVREEQDQLFQHFRAVTEGTKELKLHVDRRQDFLENDLHTTANQLRQDTIRSLILFATTSTWGQLMLFFAIGLVLFLLPVLISIPPQTLAGYILTFIFLMSPMDNLVNNLPQISRASVALQKIEALGLSLDEQTEVSTSSPPLKTTWQSLELRHITHLYQGDEDSQFVLGPIDLTFRPGELVFIVGGNGSGKSTLAKLITGLYVPEAGEILLDGEPIGSENRDWYRQHFSAVFTDFYLFDRLLGLTLPDFDRVVQTRLQQLHLDRKVKIENRRLSTTALSQGQRKRLALLTAYLEDRPIYLFDEWAADQDPIFKDLFYTQLLPELRQRGKTIFVISHDDHYFQVGDRLIKLDYGKVEYDKH